MSHVPAPLEGTASHVLATSSTDLPTPPSPDGGADVLAVLRHELERTDQEGRQLCALLGITSTWGGARWFGGSTPERLVPVYRVTVHGANPTPEAIATITARLARHGWQGGVTAHGSPVRVDCTREDATMTLTAENGSVTLVVQRRPTTVGRGVANRVLAGVYEDD